MPRQPIYKIIVYATSFFELPSQNHFLFKSCFRCSELCNETSTLLQEFSQLGLALEKKSLKIHLCFKSKSSFLAFDVVIDKYMHAIIISGEMWLLAKISTKERLKCEIQCSV